MGYQVGETCFNDLPAAQAAFWSVGHEDMTPGTTSYIVSTQWSGAAWQMKRYTLSSTGTLTLNSTTAVPVVSFPTCEVLPPVADLATAFGGGFVLPMTLFLIAYSAGTLASFFNHDR